MIVDLDRVLEKELNKATVCILGGGVAGLVLANELRNQMKGVVVLESGTEQFSMRSQKQYATETFPENFPDPNYSRLRFLGGSSNHWENSTSPLSPIDFEKRSWIENSGWPITYADIEPFYSRAADYCGTKSDGYETDYWTAQLNHQDVLKSSRSLSTGVAKAASPPTRFFSKYKEPLTSSTNVTIYKNANVVDLEFDSQQEKVDRVFVESKPGKRHSIDADIFVMCFGGIENPRYLLEFNQKYSNKLGNQGDCVGRYFMEHPVVRAAHFHAQEQDKFAFYHGEALKGRTVKGFFQLNERALKEHLLTNMRMPLIPATNYTLSDGISSYHSINDAISDFELPDEFGNHVYNIFSDIDMVIEAVSRKSFDAKLFEQADQFGGFELQIMIEQTPDRDNRIKLGEQKDDFGIRKVIVDWRLSEQDKERMWQGLELVAKDIGASSLGRLKLLKDREDRMWGSQLGFGNHHMGTTRMSESSAKGVVDKNQKVFGTSNLFIGGSSVFSTGGHVPPTLTIVAMAVRLAEHIKGVK